MQSQNRLLFVDGLRGVAASMVVVFHFWANLPAASRDVVPELVGWVIERASLGVDIFFVLSGFVIAHSIRSADLSGGYVARFALRRSIRLDPPLWITIAIECALIRIALEFFPALNTPIPTTAAILANATYTYRFLGQPEILSIFWSLTYEVQFYMVLVVSALLLRSIGVTARRSVGAILFYAAFAYSLLIWLGVLPLPLMGLFIDRWFEFALGVAAWTVTSRAGRTRDFVILMMTTIVLALLLPNGEYRVLTVFAACATAAALAVAGLRGKMGSLSGSVIQFLGRISYSLYLLHLPIGWRAMSLLKELAGPEVGALAGWGIFLVGIASSVLVSWLMYTAIERPSMNIARRVTLRSRTEPKVLEVATA